MSEKDISDYVPMGNDTSGSTNSSGNSSTVVAH